ncbi:MAG: deoxyribonuclease IV [Bacilli bacterium]|nr:deoxyribonuclease IV [Bacilli bacterium]MDD4407018.1 deoxyribonuclease IV [Bacilli bacterium]
MLVIGSHVSYGKNQLLGCAKQAIAYGANTFMFYTGAPQNTIRTQVNKYLTIEAYKLMKENNILADKIICHAPYIINLANNIFPDKYEFSMKFLRTEIDRCNLLKVKYLIIHPGSAVKHEKDIALNNIINALNKVLKPEDDITILLETMAGKGTEIGINIEELKIILDGVLLKAKIGFCLDTCHLNDSGINISKIDDYLNKFDSIIGLNKIKCIHINDSKNEIGFKKDRHANIGYGMIGFDNLINIIYHDKLKHIPKILETPHIEEKPPYKYEIEMIKNKKFNPNLMEDIIIEKINNY